MDFTEIWNEAYNIYADFAVADEEEAVRQLNKFLAEVINDGQLSVADAIYMANDVVTTFEL